MKNVLFTIIILLAGLQVSGQEEIIVDDALQCPYFISVSTGGQFDVGCPATGYIIVWAGVTYPSKILYSINNGISWSSNYEFYNLPQGNYNVKIKVNINGQECVTDYPYNPVKVTYRDYLTQYWNPSTGEMVTTGKVVIDTVTVTNPANCTGTGSLTVVPIVGGNSLEYSLDGVNFQSSPVFNNLSVGRYRVFVRKIGWPCIIEYRHMVVIYPNNLIKGFDYTYSKTCTGYNLTLTATPANSVEYSINNGSSWQSSGYFPNVQPGYYTLLCRKSGCVYIPDNNQLTLTGIKPQIFNVQYTPGPCGSPGNLSFILAHQRDKKNFLEYQTSTDNINYTTQNGNLDPVTIPVNQGVTKIYIKVRWFNINTGTFESCTYYFNIPQTLGVLDAPSIQSVNPQCNQSNGSITVLPYNSHYLYSIDDGATWSSSNIFQNLAPGNYQVKVKTVDNLCFSPSNTATLINENIPPAINGVSVMQLSDCGMNDGKITISFTNGTGSTLFSINNGSTWSSSNIFTSLPADNYNVKIKNSNNSCPVDYGNNPVVITPLLPPQITGVSHTNVSDCGASDGTITISATAGSYPVQYSIDNGATWKDNGAFTGLAPGEYLIKVRNNVGNCIVTYAQNPVIIAAPQPPVLVSVTPTGVSDCGSSDGKIVIQATMGSSPTQYSIDNGNTWQTTGTFSGLTAGDYTIKVRNDNGTCVITWPSNPVTVTTPIAPSITNVSITNTTDCNANDGTITIQATPGSSSPLYSINDGTTWQSGSSFGGLSPGQYTIKVKNNNNTCPVSWADNPVTLPGHNPPAFISVQQADVTDCGLADGKIIITAATGEGNILYSINDGSSWSTNATFSNLGQGNYIVKIKNSNGTCAVAYNNNPVIIGSPAPPSFTNVLLTNVSDCNISDGKIEIVAQQGSDAIQYSIDDGASWSSSGTFWNLAEGQYLLKLKNQNNTCVVTFPQNPVTITGPTAPQINSVDKSDASDCDTDNGTITVMATPGSGSTLFSVDDGNTWQSTGIFQNLGQGTYLIKVKNSDGTCVSAYASNPVVINAPSSPAIIGVDVQQPIDCDDNLGSIIIQYSPGSGNPQFTIDGGNSWHDSPAFADIPTGTYFTGIRNADGSCAFISTSPTLINAIQLPVIQNISIDGLIGCTSGLASIYIAASGQSGMTLQYSIDGGNNWQTNPLFSNLSSGTYALLVRYNGGICQVMYNQNPVVLNQIAPPSIQTAIIEQPQSCDNPATGSIVISATDANNLPMQYSINNGNSWSTGASFASLPPGTYQILVKNSLGCQTSWNENPVTLSAPSQPVITSVETILQPGCAMSNGSIKINYTASDAVRFSIDNGVHWQASPVFDNLHQGTYTILIRNSDGNCQNHYSQNPFILTEIVDFSVVSVQWTQPSTCDADDGSIHINTSPATGDFEYSIDGGQSYVDSPDFAGLGSGMYQIRVRRKGSNCISTYNKPVVLTAPDAPFIQDIVISQPGCNGATGTIWIVSDNPQSRYSIDNGQTWQDTALFTGLPEGIYHPAVSMPDGSCFQSYPEPVELTLSTPFNILEVKVQDNKDCLHPNGSIEITASQTGLMFSIDGGTTWSDNGIFSGLGSGSYNVVVRDPGTGCTVTYPVPAVVGADTGAEILSIDYLSTANCDQLPGYIRINAAGTDLKYSIDGGNSWSANPYFDHLTPGTYIIAVQKDACIIRGDTLVFEPYIQLYLQSSDTQLPSDCGMADGMLTINCPGAVGYSIDGSVGFVSDNMFANLAPGIYLPSVVSAQGCKFDFAPIPLYPDASGIIDSVDVILPEDCVSPGGAIIIYPDDQGTQLKFSIDLGSHWVDQTNFDSLTAGQYFVLVRDETSQCTMMWPDPLDITGKNVPIVDSVDFSYNLPCKDGHGEILIHTTGQNLLFTIDNGMHWSSESYYTGLSDGLYIIYARDTLSGCTSIPDTVRLSNSVPDLHIGAMSTGVTACGINDGAITFAKYPDTETSLDLGMTWQRTTSYTGLKPGRYNLWVRNYKNGCTGLPLIFNIGWPEFDPDSINIGYLDAYCGQAVGSINIEARPELLYSLDQGAHWSEKTHYDKLNAGPYEILIREGDKCLFSPGFPVEIVSRDSIEYGVIEEKPTCKGMDNGSITLTFPPNIIPEIVWDNNQHDLTRQGNAGEYTVMMTYGTCAESHTVTIPESDMDNLDWNPHADTVLCTTKEVIYTLPDQYHYEWYIDRIWKDSSAVMSIPDEADIRLLISDSRGCVTVDQWRLDRADEPYDFDFLLPSEGVIHFPVIGIDISKPIPEKVEWTSTSEEREAEKVIANQYHLVYGHPGIYTVEAHYKAGQCEDIVKKQVRIYATKDSLTYPHTGIANRVIASLTLTPNPNTGTFKLIMEYFDIQPGNIWIYNAAGNRVFSRRIEPLVGLEEVPIELPGVRPGVYSLVYLADTGEFHWLHFIIIQ